MTELRHLQMVILGIIKDVDKLCRNNNIEYYLLGGSAIGAIRHKGFIPWDDDLDIIMTNDNYTKFLEICKEQLDKDKYYLQEGLIDWPLNYSKIKLRGTHIHEHEEYIDGVEDGIFIDVFKMDNVSGNPIIGRWQYFCAKYYLSYTMSVRTYKSGSLKKRLMIASAFPLKCKSIRNFFVKQTTIFNHKYTPLLGFFYGRTRWKSGVIPRKFFGKPTYVDFEDTKLPVAEHYHEYLTQVFGDYMKLPPKEQQVGLHTTYVDFGKY